MRALAFLLALAACADHKPTPAAVGSGSGVPTIMPSITAKVVGSKPGRPPLTRLLVDVQLANDAAEPRWVLVPSKLPAPTSGGIDKLEQLTASGLAIGRFLGGGGLYALRLAPGARVTLRKLEVGWWRTEGQPVPAFDMRFAPVVMLGDQPMASWFDKDPTISGAADVDMEAARHTASHKTDDGAEVPLAAPGATTTSVQLSAP